MLDTFVPPGPLRRSTLSALTQTPNQTAALNITVENAPANVFSESKSTKQPKADALQSLSSTLPSIDTHSPQGVSAAALRMISQETEAPLSELLDDCLFADLGVDSLLSLQITGKMREVLDIDMPSSTFMDHPTVGEFRVYLSQYDLEGSSPSMR